MNAAGRGRVANPRRFRSLPSAANCPIEARDTAVAIPSVELRGTEFSRRARFRRGNRALERPGGNSTEFRQSDFERFNRDIPRRGIWPPFVHGA
jgi:hypothetical protein